MTTRTKLIISSYTVSIMMLLNVFSKPLHIPESIQWALIIGAFIPLGLMFHFIRKQKKEKLAPVASGNIAPQPAAESPKTIKNRLILIMAIGVVIGLCAPLWMPLTGTTLGTVGDLVCGLITAAIVCLIFGLRLRKL
jgi:purine-cytosine permease-like protein